MDAREKQVAAFFYLPADYIIQVRNADISFDERNLIDLFWERPLLNVVLDAYVVVGCGSALRNKHL